VSVAVQRVPTIAAALAEAAASLAAAGVREPRADAEVLLAHVLGTTRPALVAHGPTALDATSAARFETLVARRARRTPVWQILGRREFWSLDVDVDARVLTPRPETEMLVELAVRLAPAGGVVVDAGTGSGAIAVAVARERPDLRVLAIDVDRSALAVAARNRRRLAPGVALVRASWLSACAPASVDVVVANPPYVPDAVLETLDPEVRDHEPVRALAGGVDGLRETRRLVAAAADVLVPGGWLVVEIGDGQAAPARALCAGPAWWPEPVVHADLAGTPRCLVARRGTP
jgi:release factor glutamine methyltransferase